MAMRGIGKSFAGILFTDREVQGGGHNRVIGPDFLWKMDGSDRLLGQLLMSDTLNPSAIPGDSGRGHAARFVYTRDKKGYDIWSQSFDYSPRFRADDTSAPAGRLQADTVCCIRDVELGRLDVAHAIAFRRWREHRSQVGDSVAIDVGRDRSGGYRGWILWSWDTTEQPTVWNALSDGGAIERALSPRWRKNPCADLGTLQSITPGGQATNGSANQPPDQR